MFHPGRPQPPMPPHRPSRRQMQTPNQTSNKHKLINQFRDSEGNLDINKITATAQQVGQLYEQVSPLIAKLKKRPWL